ncbi:hypothetical protein FRC20_010185 [Serendipita sp. 405]|nr:hypothetical protein FRC20_010185 [Serendipita sp. 405]
MPPVPHQDPKIGNRPCSECRRIEGQMRQEDTMLQLRKKRSLIHLPRRIVDIWSWKVRSAKHWKFVLSGTEELHTQVQQLSMRVKKLEAALEAAHNLVSTETHPLLAETERVNLLVETDSPSPAMEGPDMNDELAGQFSMLAIEGDVKTSRFTTSQYSLWFLDGQAVSAFLAGNNVCVKHGP